MYKYFQVFVGNNNMIEKQRWLRILYAPFPADFLKLISPHVAKHKNISYNLTGIGKGQVEVIPDIILNSIDCKWLLFY